MTAATPWWSSGDTDDLDHDQDPLDAHVAARGLDAVPDTEESGERTGDRTGDGTGDGRGDRTTDAGETGGDDPTADGSEHAAICGVCPICRGHAALQGRHPELAGHLAEAARHLALALAGFADVVDTARAGDTDPGSASGVGDATTGFTDIPLDDLGDESAPDPPHDDRHDGP